MGNRDDGAGLHAPMGTRELARARRHRTPYRRDGVRRARTDRLMQDRPTAAELLRAAREFCERELLGELKGRRQFHTRVLINVLSILEREWDGEDDALRAEWKRLA